MTNRDMSDPGDGGAAAIVAGLLVVVAVMLAIFLYVGIDGAQAHRIDLDVKSVATNSASAK